mgnify:CR=1 FL=1
MKIRPATTFIDERKEIFGDPPVVHFLLGTRFDESAARKGTMDAHTRMDSDLHAHGTIPTASTIRPIENWSTDDVWQYLLKLDWVNGMPNPFADNDANTTNPISYLVGLGVDKKNAKKLQIM